MFEKNWIFYFPIITLTWVTREILGGHQLIFAEEFDCLNTTIWEHIITGFKSNNEFQYYTNRRENSYVKNGVLFIKPTLTADRFSEEFLYSGILDLNKEGCNVNWNNGCVVKPGVDIINPIQSARIRTLKSFSFTYGKVEVSAKMPRGDWIWPAIWLLPTKQVYGNWPRSGEIDIVEIRGNDNFTCSNRQMGNSIMASTLHYGPDSLHNYYKKTTWSKLLKGCSFSNEFHVYGLEWSPSVIRFTLDGKVIGEKFVSSGGFWELTGLKDESNNPWINGTRMAPFDQSFHFVLDVAVGGTFFPDGCINAQYKKPWTGSSPHPMQDFWEKYRKWYPTWSPISDNSAMQVDYIRVFAPDDEIFYV